MRSMTISTRVGTEAYNHLCKYCLDNGITPSDILSNALFEWRLKPEVPEYLKNSLASERADMMLKVKLRRILFLHNVQRKVKKLYLYENLDFFDTKRVIIPIIELFSANAKTKGYEREHDFLENKLKEFNSPLPKDQFEFSKWSGLSESANRGKKNVV